MNTLLKISVVIPTRNRAQTLKRMLDKLFEDAYPNLEVIIIDAASTDGTQDVIKSYGNRISKWVSEPDGGEYFGINKGIALATGDIVKLMSDDDVLRPGVLQKVAAYFDAHPDVEIVFGQTVVWEERSGTPVRLFETVMMDESRLKLWNWIHERQTVTSLSSFLRRGVFQRIGLMSTEYICGDVEYWTRAASRGVKMGLMPDVVIDYYYTGLNGILTKRWRVAADIVRINAKYGSAMDVLAAVWRKFIKPFTYRPLADIARGALRAVGLDVTDAVNKRNAIKA